MKKRIASLFCLIAVCVIALCGCSGVKKYHAVIVENYALREDFWSLSGDCLPEVPSDPVPSERAFLFLNQEQLNEAFVLFPAVDFANEMVAVYEWRAIYARKLFLSDVRMEEERVSIDFRYQKGKHGVADACEPSPRLIVVKLNKSDFIKKADVLPTVEFNLLNPRG